ncbi:MAG: hypothetical protein ACI86P_000885, partial [Flavobacteriales bacterium]
KNLSLLALLLFTNSLIFAQEKEREEKGSKHIKIEAEIDGKTIEIDTIITAGAEFDHAEFLNSVGLEDEIKMDFDDEHFTIEIDTEDGKSMTKEIRMQIEECGEENEKNHKMMTKTIMIMGDDESEDVDVIKTISEDGKEEIRIIHNPTTDSGETGKEMDGEKHVIVKKMHNDEDVNMNESSKRKKVKIATDKDESMKDYNKSSEMKYWVDKDGKKHKIKEGDRVIIIEEEK